MKSKILLFIFLAILVNFFFITIGFTSTTFSLLLYNIGKFLGLVAFLSLSVLIISGDTARFLDKFFGMDRIIKFQRSFSLFTTLFVLAHPLFFMFSSKRYLNYLIPDFVYLPLSLGILAFYVFFIVILASTLYKRISYNAWQYLHILIYALFFISAYHAFQIGSDISNLFINYLFKIIILCFILSMIYRTVYKWNHRKFKCTVENIKWETKDTFTLTLKPNKKLKFKAGQFCFLRINKDKLYARHPFTISSSPKDKNLRFTIKLEGRFTKRASTLKKGEQVIVDGPFGRFTINEPKNLVFLAGGVGITPFMSIIRDLKNKKPNIVLLYGSRESKGIIFKKELDSYKWLNKIYVLSQEKKKGNWKTGYVTKEIINSIPNLTNSKVYICGPEKMKEHVLRILKEIGIKDKNIQFESFFW